MEPEGSLPHSQVPVPVPILSQLDPFHTLTSYFLKIHFNIILPSTPGSSKWSFPLRFRHQNPVYASPLPHTRYMSRPTHSSRFYYPKNLGEDYRSLSSSLCSFLHSPVTLSLLGPNILLRIQRICYRTFLNFLTVRDNFAYFSTFKLIHFTFICIYTTFRLCVMFWDVLCFCIPYFH